MSKELDINGPIPLNPGNPLLTKLTPAEFQASVKFYEADHRLTQTDRVELAKDLDSALLRTKVGGHLFGSLGFFGLSIYKQFKNRTNPQPFVPGKFFPGGFIHRPLLSFFIGLGVLAVSTEAFTVHEYLSKVRSLGNEPDKERQLNVWRVMFPGQMGIFQVYYDRSSEDASIILKDPRTFTQQDLHKVQYHEPHVPKNPRSPFKKQDERQVVDPVTKELTHWEQIRRSNGYGQNDYKSDRSVSDTVESDPIGDTDPIEPESDPSPSTTPKSAWDKIRSASTSTK